MKYVLRPMMIAGVEFSNSVASRQTKLNMNISVKNEEMLFINHICQTCCPFMPFATKSILPLKTVIARHKLIIKLLAYKTSVHSNSVTHLLAKILLDEYRR